MPTLADLMYEVLSLLETKGKARMIRADGGGILLFSNSPESNSWDYYTANREDLPQDRVDKVLAMAKEVGVTLYYYGGEEDLYTEDIKSPKFIAFLLD